ncbi:hypothetical protein [Brevibacillus dissolubilis]|uniref:hypothetical protein n=1 Tax=Brevibacillus dissolubilis TaxID=1844116 RepID=UPI001116AD05|nr:hypothetical protein [Brevibacillus dissolubilis]
MSTLKKAWLLATSAILLVGTAAVGPADAAKMAAVKKPVYTFTYKLPTYQELEETYSFQLFTHGMAEQQPTESHKVIDGATIVYDILELESETAPMQALIDPFAFSKNGFLLEVSNLLSFLPPAYPAGYDPTILSKRERGITELKARMQALVHAGYLMPEELDLGGFGAETIASEEASKEFAAEVLYRIFKEARPYKGSGAPKDSTNEAVRWAVEVGLPGFVPDKLGNVYPASGYHPSDYQKAMDYIRYFLPSKKTISGWEYYSFAPSDLNQTVQFSGGWHIYVNGYQLNSSPYHADIYKLPALATTQSQLASALQPYLPKALEHIRSELKKPRVFDWRTDVIQHPTFQQVVANYRKTKSKKALDEAYAAIRNTYNLTLIQDNINGIKSVLDNIK